MRRVGNRRVGSRADLEEPLPHPFVDYDQGMLWQLRRLLVLALVESVLLLNDLVELLQFVVDDLLSRQIPPFRLIRDNHKAPAILQIAANAADRG